MKKYFLSILFSASVLSTAVAQRTPQLSPGATVIQTVGVTDFTIKYSRPALKGRKVFGDSTTLAPYNQLWRTGANQPTSLEATTEFTFGGKRVAAGKYALYTIPGGGSWTIILNKNFENGLETYSETNDVSRVTIVPQSSDFTEFFTIEMTPASDSTASLNIKWSSVNVAVPVSVYTEALTLASLNKAVAEKPEDVSVLQTAAGFLLSKGKNLQVALGMADKAIGLKASFSNLWLKAQILDRLGKPAEALPLARKALEMGAASGDSFYAFIKPQIEKTIPELESKTNAAKAVASAAKSKKPKKGK